MTIAARFRMSLIAVAVVVLAAPSLADGPGLVRTKLENGVAAVVCPRPSRGLAAVDVWVRAGSALERPGEFGAAHFVEHLLFRGTAQRDSGEADREIEALGGLLNAGTTRDFAHLFAVLPAERLPEVLAVMADVLMASRMLDAHVTIERSIILDELASALNDPDRGAVESAFRIAWAGTPYSRPVLSFPTDIAKLDRDSIVAFYRRCYQPEHIVVVVAGEVGLNATIEAVKSTFGTIMGAGGTPALPDVARAMPDGAPTPEPGPVYGPVRTTPRPGAASEEIWAWRLGRRDIRDAFAAELLAAVIEGALSSAKSPQTAGEPTSGIRAEFIPLAHGGLLYIAAAVGASGQGISPALIEAVVRRLAADGPTDGEVELARRRVLGRSLFRQETCAGLARELGLWAMLGDAEAPMNIGSRLKQIGRQDLKAYAARWLGAVTAREGQQP